MKTRHFILLIIILITGAILAGCNNNRDKSKNDKEDVKQAAQDLKDEQAQFERDWQQFKNDAEIKISDNEKRINDFKAEIQKTNAKFKSKYENKVLTLEQKNIELRKMINNYIYEGKDSWKEFKSDFSNNMDSVANSLNDIFAKKD
jgi:outer membrane murein-binding lipoprotein Lpp